MSPATKKYQLEKIFTYGRTSHTVNLSVPMCSQHDEAASFKSLSERIAGSAAVAAGVIVGLFGAYMMFVRWQGPGNLLSKLLAGGLLAFGFFILVWWILYSSLVPLFAARESKAARNAVRIIHYWPKDQIVRLSLENEPLAEIVQTMS